MSVDKQEVLSPGRAYHIYNKAIGSDKLFITEKDYHYFFKKLERFIIPVADILCYCLIPNHFHLLVKIKETKDLEEKPSVNKNGKEKFVHQAFSNLLNSYTKSFNKAHKRVGRLFLYSDKRILVDDDNYLSYLVCYIHQNPIHHGMTNSYFTWKHSSFKYCLSTYSDGPIGINKDYVISLFGDRDELLLYHEENRASARMDELLLE